MRSKSFILIFSLMLTSAVFGQTEKFASLAYGEWIYDTEDKDFFGRLLLMDDGTFEMASKRTGSEEELLTGTFVVEGEKLKLTFDKSGTSQINTIEILDEQKLQFRYIETVYHYQRAGS